MTLPRRGGRPREGEYATLTHGGEFPSLSYPGERISLSLGQRCRVLNISHNHNPKKVWVNIHVIDDDGRARSIVSVPWWWLRPRSILDDIAGM